MEQPTKLEFIVDLKAAQNDRADDPAKRPASSRRCSLVIETADTVAGPTNGGFRALDERSRETAEGRQRAPHCVRLAAVDRNVPRPTWL